MSASLFDPERPPGMVVRVVPDQTGITKTFDYVVPPELIPAGWDGHVAPGTRVRVELGRRRVGAWVVAVDVDAATDTPLKPVAKISGLGPPPDLVALADWARWRWAAKSVVPFLRTASPARVVSTLPAPGERRHPVPPADDDVIQGAFRDQPTVLRLPPTADLVPVVQAAASLGDPLILCTSRRHARQVADRLRRAGVATALHPDDWAAAASGGHAVVGTRAAAWAPVPDLAAIVVFDEHDEVHQEERSPTWHARDVALERARRAGVPCVLTSPMPTLEALGHADLVTVDRAVERAGWPVVVVVDRRDEDTGRNALFSPALADIVRSDARVVCILNRKGRAALLACASCASIVQCERCDAAVHRPDEQLVCRRCGHARPVVCAACGSLDLRTVRMGVQRVSDDLAALAGEAVTTITGDTPDDALSDGRLFVGTEAALHRVPSADVVAFLDLDQELFAPRYRAAEQALGLLVRASRLVGPRNGGGRVLVQTRDPDHEVVQAALHGDPQLVTEAERARRELLGFPPFTAIADVGDQAGEALAERVSADDSVSVQGPLDGSWRIVAPDQQTLSDALARVERPPGRLRLAVDPPRI